MINPRTHASLVEVAHRIRQSLQETQDQARAGVITATRTADGWVMDRADAEALIADRRSRGGG